MIENKLQLIARTIGRWAIASKGTERSILAEVLALVTEVMGRDKETSSSEDPVFWFDEKGRFCTRAQTKEEVESSMVLMAIAEGISLEDMWQEDHKWPERAKKWDVFQDMKLRYMEERMRVKELEAELEEAKQAGQVYTGQRRIGDIDQIKKLMLLSMDLAGVESITKDDLACAFDLAPDIGTAVYAIMEKEGEHEYRG